MTPSTCPCGSRIGDAYADCSECGRVKCGRCLTSCPECGEAVCHACMTTSGACIECHAVTEVHELFTAYPVLVEGIWWLGCLFVIGLTVAVIYAWAGGAL